MRTLDKEAISRNVVLGVIGISLLLVVMLGVVVSADDTEPTWRPPSIAKWATKSSLKVGETVKFLITVKNPADPLLPDYPVVVTWYQVAASDIVSDVFDILATGIPDWEGTKPTITVSDNTVTATVASMDPGDWFVLEIQCKLVGPVDQGAHLINRATVAYYEDESGRLGITYDSEAVSILVGHRLMFPIIARNHTP